MHEQAARLGSDWLVGWLLGNKTNPLTLVSSVLSTEFFGICSVAVVVSCGSILFSGGQSVLL